jgi:hypothetical protein
MDEEQTGQKALGERLPIRSCRDFPGAGASEWKLCGIGDGSVRLPSWPRILSAT